jgi:hypothetical protein
VRSVFLQARERGNRTIAMVRREVASKFQDLCKICPS